MMDSGDKGSNGADRVIGHNISAILDHSLLATVSLLRTNNSASNHGL